MKTYHVIVNGEKRVIDEQERTILTEQKNNMSLDIEWYISNGDILLEDFLKEHPL